MDAFNTGLIVPKVSFWILAFTLQSFNIKFFSISTCLTFFCCFIVELPCWTFVTERAFDQIWFGNWACAFLFRAVEYKISITLYSLTLKRGCTKVESFWANKTLFCVIVEISWKFTLDTTILCFERFVIRTFFTDGLVDFLLTFFWWNVINKSRLTWSTFLCFRIKVFILLAINACLVIKIRQFFWAIAWIISFVVDLIWWACAFI